MDGVRKKSLKELLPKDELQTAVKGRQRRLEPEIEARVESIESLENEPAYNNGFVAPTQAQRSKAHALLWICLVSIGLAGVYYASAVFATATITITPKEAVVDLGGELNANRAPSTGIEFSIMKLSDETVKIVPSGGQAKVVSKAKGTATITNNFSSASQPLMAGTRLSTPGGQIYKLDSSVVVPGNGKITVKVTAAEAGPEYNHGRVDLKIVGFKGTAKYDKFAAESAGFSGGQNGLVNIVKDEDRIKARGLAEAELKTKLAEKARLQIPKGQVIFPAGMRFLFSEKVGAQVGTSTNLTVSGEMTALMFDEAVLSEELAAKFFPGEAVEGIRIKDIPTIKFTVSDDDFAKAVQKNELSFTLSGKAKFVWPVETVALIEKLRGVGMGGRADVFSAFPNIHRAEAYIRPPWILAFPANSEKINVVQQSGEDGISP